MSTFLDEANDLAKKRGGTCVTCSWLDGLPDDVQAEVIPVIDGHLAPVSGVIEALARRGHPVPSDSSFRRHWLGGCKGRS